MFCLVSKTFKIFILGVFVFTLFLPFSAEASFSISPPVIDESGVPRDAISKTVTLINRYDDRRLRIFTFVNNVSFEDNTTLEGFTVLKGLDSADSLANWVSVSRQQIVLGPGESKEVPVVIEIDKDASPGKYHAFVSFSQGSRRSEAEGSISRDRAVLLAIEVKDDSEDILNLSGFSTEESIVTGSPVAFLVTLDNQGDTTLTPEGEVSVYNRRGREIGVVPFNEEGLSIEPQEEKDFRLLWEGDIDWGKNRARLTVNYGSRGRRYTLNDTFSFTMIPVITLSLIFFSLLLVVIFLTHIFHEYQKKALAQNMGNSFRKRISDDEEMDENTINLRGF